MSGSARAHGKCILAGEHSVVRGGEALVLPLLSRFLEISWAETGGAGLTIQEGPLAAPFRSALDRALATLRQPLPPRGLHLAISSNIPVRAGLGSSAALSVALVRFLEQIGISGGDPFSLALEVENHFHGTSSGIDVACALAARPTRFRRGLAPQQLKLAWRPRLFLADSGARSATRECVEKVQSSGRRDLDARMEGAVQAAAEALAVEAPDSLARLAAALNEGAAVFREWGLFAGEELACKLREAGALAVKPTGSGGGGFLLTLWNRPPPAGLGLIPVWEDSSGAP